MGTQNYLWHFVLSVLLSGTLMALEGRDTTTATTASHLNISRSTSNSSRSGPAADSSNGFVAEPHTPAQSLLGTTSLSPSTMSLMGAEGKMNTAPTAITQEGGSLGMSAQSSAVSSAFPTAGTITTTAPSTGTETGAAASPPLSSTTRSHSSSSSSSSSSSPGGSPAVPPSPQRSSTTQMLSATTSQPLTALVSSSSSAAGTAQLPSGSETQGPVSSSSSAAGTAQLPAGSETQGPASPRPVPSTSPASATMEAQPSPTETRTPQLGPTALPQGQTPTATSPPTGSPSPSTASAGSSATTSPGEEGSTMFQGDTTTTETSRSFPATSLVSMMTMVGGEERTDTAPTTTLSEGGSLGTSPGNGAVSTAFPTTGTGTTTAPESGTASSLAFSSAVTSQSSSSSPEGSSAVPPGPQQSSSTEAPLATTSHASTAPVFSSPFSTVGTTGNESEPIMNPVTSTSGTSPEGSSAVPPSPQQSSTTGMSLATTSHPSTAPVFSTAGVTDVGSDTATAEQVTASPAPSTASTNPVASASETTAPSRSSTPGSSTGTPAPQHSSTAQGQSPEEVTVTSPPTGSPSPSTATASAGSSATTPPGEGQSSTMYQGDTTTEPTANTSHSLPSTSLATPSTTNLSISTSVHPSFTKTCSPITLSIQLQKVTSRTIQFSWKPQGGTADSPYRVRLLGKPEGVEERILNETSTAFENLLSAHQYQISVGVSACSKNVNASLTVQTAAEVYNGTTRIISENFKAGYENKSSTEFKEFEKKFIMETTQHLPQKIQELKNGTKIRIVINSIKNGSVIVIFKIVLDVGQNITKSEISDAFTEALNRSTVFKVDLKKTFIEARNSCQPGLNDCDKNAACTAEGATYSCQCKKGFTDTSTQVPGRVCLQDLPSEHTTPVPPKTNTTGFTGTTSNSVFTTTFASAPCMTVSIKVQNVTEEEIQLSWSSSSSKGSLYNISVKDGKEIHATTTNETKAVFKNLLPGHVYTISVGLSSCADNNPASVTVRTDSGSCFRRPEFCLAQSTGCSDLKDIVCLNNQAFACRVRLKNETFNNTLYNSDSDDYIKRSESFKAKVVKAMHTELGNDHSDIFVLDFRPGSVIADFLFLLPKEEATDVGDIQTRLSNVLRREFGSKIEVQTLAVQSSTDNSSSWRVAVIVLGVLLGVALVLILLAILFYICVRRRSGMEFSPLYT